MKKLNNRGFSALEPILIIVIVGILGFTGWFVYHSRQVADKTLITTQNSVQQAKDNYKYHLVVKEWGVEFPYNSPDDLSYTMPSTHNVIVLTSKAIATEYGCQGSDTGMVIARRTGNEYISDKHETFAQEYAKEGGDGTIKFGNYYYQAGGFDINECPPASSKVADDAAIKTDSFLNVLIRNTQRIH